MILRPVALFSRLRSSLSAFRAQGFHAAPLLLASKLGPPRPKVKEEDLEESFLKGSGPGGQKIVLLLYETQKSIY